MREVWRANNCAIDAVRDVNLQQEENTSEEDRVEKQLTADQQLKRRHSRNIGAKIKNICNAQEEYQPSHNALWIALSKIWRPLPRQNVVHLQNE